MLSQQIKQKIKGGEKMRNKRGQSVLEYVIVLTAIIAIIIVAATTFIKPAVQQSMDDASQAITTATGKLVE